MLEDVLNNLHNFFVQRIDRGRFTISSGALESVDLLPGQFFCIRGSVLNDGVYEYPATELRDETWEGEIWALAIPRAVLALAGEIEEWVQKHPLDDKSSESFGGYSYSKAAGSSGAPITWSDVFRTRLNPWRKLA